jgi:hypothetical protein
MTKVRHLKAHGIAASMQPRRYLQGSNKTPDGIAEFGMSTVFWDDVVTNPLSQSNLNDGRGVEQAERRKQAKYEEDLKQQGYQFRAFSVDVFGKFGDDALKFVDEIAAHAEQAGTATAKQARNDLLDELSVQLHKMNARITQRAVNDNRHYRNNNNLLRDVQAAAAAANHAIVLAHA